MNLKFYMFDEKTQDFEQALNPEKFEGLSPYKELEFKIAPPFEGKAFLQKNRRIIPDWLKFFSKYLDIQEEDIENTSNSLVVLVKESGRIFATTKGYGYSALNREHLERQFGLRVVLNAIDPNNIRMIDSRQLDTTTKQKRIFLSKNSPFYEFDFDVNADLLRLISGEPTNENLAKKLSGSDSLSLSADVEFDEIGQKCKELFQEFGKDTYKNNFPFIDYIYAVKDPELVEALDEELKSAIIKREDNNLVLAYPEIIDFESTVRFRVTLGKSSTTRITEIDLQAIYGFLNGLNPPENIADVKIIGLDDSGARTTKAYDLYEFCVFEVEYKNQKYLLSLAQWFEIAEDYVSEVSQALQEIEELEAGFLPNMVIGQSEADYNQAVGGEDNPHFASLDKNNYPAGGFSKIEVCDILSEDAEFICVKKYNSSSTLSHLFSQGYVSSELLLGVPDYRKFVLEQCPKFSNNLPFTMDTINSRESITFVFAIAFSGDKTVVERLPFFSRVNLNHFFKAINKFGFKVKIYKIPIVE